MPKPSNRSTPRGDRRSTAAGRPVGEAPGPAISNGREPLVDEPNSIESAAIEPASDDGAPTELPATCGDAWGYYLSRRQGQRMLVLMGKKGQRLRVNESLEIVVLEVDAGQVTIGVEKSPTRSPGSQRKTRGEK